MPFRKTMLPLVACLATLCGCGMLEPTPAENTPNPEQIESDAVGHFAEGVALEERGLLDEAIDQYEQAREADPQSAHVAMRLGAALWRASRRDEAVPHIAAAEKAAAERPEIALKLAEFYLTAERYDDALRMSAALEAAGRYKNPARRVRAQVLLRTGKPAEAEALFEALAESGGERRDWMSLGRAREALRQPSRAAAAYARAASEPAAAMRAVELYAALGNFPAAFEIAREHLRFIPPQADISDIDPALPPSPISSISPWHYNPPERTRTNLLRGAYVRIAWHARTHRSFATAREALAEAVAATGEFAEARECLRAIDEAERDEKPN